MRKIIAAINMTLDGFCDHTSIVADDELHDHYNGLLHSADMILYGRITYQLMEYWPTVVQDPSGNRSTDEFAVTMDKIPKLVFSRTLKHVDWGTARLATGDIEEEVSELRQQAGKDILVGSRSLIVTFLNLSLIDELQLTVQPITAGKGLPLFQNINEGITLNLVRTKPFRNSGSITLYYQPVKDDS